VRAGRDPYLLNLAWELVGNREGTFYIDNLPHVLDQMLVNAAMLDRQASLAVAPTLLEMEQFPGMTGAGRYPSPIAFGGMGKPVNERGYSDHLPIAIRVIELD